MKLTLEIWRQVHASARGAFVRYELDELGEDMSFLEALDMLNERLMGRGEVPVAFDHDCREGICGACGMMIDGVAHGPMCATATCQLFLRHFRDGSVVCVEPWRSKAFPVIKDLVVDRSAFDRIIAAGGFIYGADRRSAGCQRHSRSEGRRGETSMGHGRVHRLRCMRRGVSKWIGFALYRRQDQPPRLAAPRAAREGSTRGPHGGAG